MRTIAITIALSLISGAAFTADPSTINPYGEMGSSTAALTESYPDLTPSEVDRLLFRVADARSMAMLRSVPITSATAINPHAFIGATRNELASAFPGLSQAELDVLLFKMAEAGSSWREPQLATAR